MEYTPICISDIVRSINRDVYLPAIQREFVWSTEKIERLFDSIMSDFPVGSFLYWRLQEEHRDKWPVYEFLRDYDDEHPHNKDASLAGVNKDIQLVLDGQQRITSLHIGLKGAYRYFYYRWRTTYLFLNLLKKPIANDENPEELTYDFKFRENTATDPGKQQLWYKVGRILDHEDAEDAKDDLEKELVNLSSDQVADAKRMVGRLHTRIHTSKVANYYEEKSQDLEKVLQIFVRANSGGQPLEYSDLLLATATAKWQTVDARKEIHSFTDSINKIGNGYTFGKDFVLKSCLYLTPGLPIAYKVKNFTKGNLTEIEKNWPTIKSALETSVRLIARFGFTDKNIVAPLALLPIALYIHRRGDFAFDTSSEADDAQAQVAIRKWFIVSTIKNAFGGSSDTTLTRLRTILEESVALKSKADFPADALYKSLEIEASFNDSEIDRILGYAYQGRYTNLALSLIYPDRDWKNAVFHEDHIFPKSKFDRREMKGLKFSDAKMDFYVANYNNLPNLELLTDSENLSKSADPFDNWLKTRDAGFCARHIIPTLKSYSFSDFEEFIAERRRLIAAALREI